MRNSNQRGFMLLTLLIASALISTLAGAWLLQEQKRMAREREVMLAQAGEELRRALDSYYRRNTPLSFNSYPGSVNELLEDRRGAYTVKHLRAVPINPVTGMRDWKELGVGGRVLCFSTASRARPGFSRQRIHGGRITAEADHLYFCHTPLAKIK
jgi:type II secretory pathway pseudopilin PulG